MPPLSHRRAKFAFCALALSLAAAAPAGALTNEEIANLAGPDRKKVLLEGAKKEGEVSFYTTLLVDQVARPVAEAFEKKYPFVALKFTRLGSSDILQRVMAESRARTVHVDVIDADIAEALKKQGLAQKFNSPVMAEYPSYYIDPERTWVSIRTSWQGIAWNTKLIKDEEAPKTWEALLEPRYKGKLAWADSSGTGAPRVITHLRKIWGEEAALDYAKKLKEQDIRTLPGSVRTVLDQVIAGERPIGVSMSMHHIAESMEKGAPITGVSPEPVIARAQTLHVVKGAPHPYAAMLLVDFILAKDGAQTVFRDAGYNPAHPGVDPLPKLRWIQPNRNGKQELLMPPEEVDAMTPKSQDIYRALFR